MNQIEAMRIYAAIDMDACRKNIDAMLAKLRSETKMTLVIKTDAYGHGALPVARLGEMLDRVWGYAVATSQEAFSLRRNGIKKPILILGYTFEGDYPEMVAQEIRPVVFRYETAEIFSRAAKEAGKTVHIHIGLDTGMHRIGFPDTAESIKEIQKIQQLENVELEGIFTHFARADEADKTYARAQLLRFVSFVTKLERAGITFKLRHAANSASIMEFPEAQIDMVRAGITIYGIYPSREVKPENLPLEPMMDAQKPDRFYQGDSVGRRCELWRHLRGGEAHEDRYDFSRVRGRLSPESFQQGLHSDSREKSSDPGPDLHGSVYGGCDGDSGSERAGGSHAHGKRRRGSTSRR